MKYKYPSWEEYREIYECSKGCEPDENIKKKYIFSLILDFLSNKLLDFLFLSG